MNRYSRLVRRTPLKRISAKRAAEQRARREMAARVFPERPICLWPYGPKHYADALHEALTRARGGSITDEANVRPMCNLHNGMLSSLPESELGWAYDAGLLKHSWEGTPS